MKSARLRRNETILVCGKCLKRHAEGKMIRKALKARGKAKDAKIVRVACLGVCPKKAVVVASRASFAQGRVMLLRTHDDTDAVLPDLA